MQKINNNNDDSKNNNNQISITLHGCNWRGAKVAQIVRLGVKIEYISIFGKTAICW